MRIDVTPALKVIALSVVLSAPAHAGPREPGPGATLDRAERASLIEGLATAYEREYHDEAIGRHVAARLRQDWREGRYDALRDGSALAETLTRQVSSLARDQHARVEFSPEPLPEGEASGPDAETMRRETRHFNCAVERIEHYPGNVSYLRIDHFAPPELCADTVSAAMATVAKSDALIIDLRHNGGGSPDMVQFMASYLLKADQPLNHIVSGRDKQSHQFWTLPAVPGVRLTDVPVLLLTSKATFSAGEHFAYDLQQSKRATVVGEATGGGANPGEFKRIHPHFAAWISLGRSVSPVTGRNWEGRGVQPDHPVPAAEAKRKAFRLALQMLQDKGASSAMPEERKDLLENFEQFAERQML